MFFKLINTVIKIVSTYSFTPNCNYYYLPILTDLSQNIASEHINQELQSPAEHASREIKDLQEMININNK